VVGGQKGRDDAIVREVALVEILPVLSKHLVPEHWLRREELGGGRRRWFDPGFILALRRRPVAGSGRVGSGEGGEK